MKSRKFIIALAITSSLSACVSQKEPICYNKAIVNRTTYEIPIFETRKPVKTKQYRSGSFFAYEWIDQGAFVDTSSCDKISVVE